MWDGIPNGRVNKAAHGYPAGRKGRPNPRNANGNARRKLRARVRALGLPCAICGKPIDYSLPAGHPMSYELDEIVPVSKGGDPLDMLNVQPSHRVCNERKGGGVSGRSRGKGTRGPSDRGALPTSRDW